jgi:hypothetical protein
MQCEASHRACTQTMNGLTPSEKRRQDGVESMGRADEQDLG